MTKTKGDLNLSFGYGRESSTLFWAQSYEGTKVQDKANKNLPYRGSLYSLGKNGNYTFGFHGRYTVYSGKEDGIETYKVKDKDKDSSIVANAYSWDVGTSARQVANHTYTDWNREKLNEDYYRIVYLNKGRCDSIIAYRYCLPTAAISLKSVKENVKKNVQTCIKEKTVYVYNNDNIVASKYVNGKKESLTMTNIKGVILKEISYASNGQEELLNKVTPIKWEDLPKEAVEFVNFFKQNLDKEMGMINDDYSHFFPKYPETE